MCESWISPAGPAARSKRPAKRSKGGAFGAEDLRLLGSPVGRGANSLTLDPGGDVAWLGEAEPQAGRPTQLVLYLHDSGGTHLIASGYISHIAFSGDRLTWVEGGTAVPPVAESRAI